MKPYTGSFLFIIAAIFLYAAEIKAQDFLWAKSFSNSVGYGIKIDANGNSYVTGNFSGAALFGAIQLTSYGGGDIFVAKFDPNGNYLWAKNAGGTGDDIAYGIAIDAAGNSFITGLFHGSATFGTIPLTSNGGSDIFAAKYDQDGNCVWAKHSGGTDDDEGYAISSDTAGHCVISGGFRGTATFGATQLTTYGYFGSADIFIAKYDQNGEMGWVKQAGGNNVDQATGILVDGNENIFITGGFNETAKFGNLQVSAYGNPDIFLAKYDSDGGCTWVTHAGSTDFDGGTEIALDVNGNIYITGVFGGPTGIAAIFDTIHVTNYGSNDIFIAKYSSDGNCRWAKSAGGYNSDAGAGIDCDPNGNVYVTGRFVGPATFGTYQAGSYLNGNDAFITSYDSTGNCLWVKRAGSTSSDGGTSISVDANGNSYFTGYFTGNVKFGTTTLTGGGGYITKMSKITGVEAEGNPLPKEFALKQNYPNPFNPSTVIKYSIPKEGMVSISVHNILGEKVSTLFNGNIKAGNHEAEFNASRLASGIYICRLQSGGFSSSIKMMLQK